MAEQAQHRDTAPHLGHLWAQRGCLSSPTRTLLLGDPWTRGAAWAHPPGPVGGFIFLRMNEQGLLGSGAPPS